MHYQQTLQHIRRAILQQSLYDFVQQAWPYIESSDYVDNWHIEAVCSHLQALYDKQIENLLINIPPGCSKSLLTSVFFPCWVWCKDPSKRFFYASYDQRLSTRDSVKCRTLLESEWYRGMFPNVVQLRKDQDQKTYFENVAGGYRQASSVGGNATGQHPDFILVDDPLSAQGAESEAERQSVIDWWDLTMSARGVSRGVRKVIIMQRLHELDLSGHVLEKGGYDHLCLPMRYSGVNRCNTSLGYTDPRSTTGELLTPKQFTETMVKKLEDALGPYGTAGQLQQEPVPRQAGFIKTEKMEIVAACPSKAEMVMARFWDTAATVGAGDYTAGVLIGKHTKTGLYYVLDVVRGQWSPEDRKRIQRQTADLDYAYPNNYPVTQLQSEEPGSAGKDQSAEFVKLMAGYSAKCYRETGSKEVRADPFASQVNAGNVKVLRGEWNKAFLDELRMFPSGKNDDQVDAASNCYAYIEHKAGNQFMPNGWRF